MSSATEGKPEFADDRVGVPLPGDNRVRVGDTTQQPSKWVGQLECTWPDNSTSTGTATLIGTRYLLTCAHNFYDTRNRTYCRSARFRPGLNRGGGGALQTPFGSYDLDRWEVPEEYVRNGGPPPPVGGIPRRDITLYLHDYAIARLDRFVRDDLGESMFQVAWPGDGQINALACRINGYSGDLDPTGCTQYTRHGGVRLSDSHEFVSYQMSTYHGDSGAPVYYQPLARPFWNVIAVHVTGVPDTGQNDGLNFGPALSGAALDWIVRRI
ncbi:MAG TPA: hypothetical protein VGG25_28035 [Streptosporangiaceae bacterium]